MDRLEQQHINPYTVPGLLPGLLGIAMILLGGVLGAAQLAPRRAGASRRAGARPTQREQRTPRAGSSSRCASATASC